MSYVTFALLPSRDVKAGSYDRGGLRSTRHSTITGILGAVSWIVDEKPKAWVGPKLEEGGWSPLDTATIAQLVQYLYARQVSGCIVVSWDGMQEAFAILSKFCTDPVTRSQCAEIALNHVDIAFQMFCSRGFVAPLRRILESMEVEDKTHGRSTAFAKSSWDKGEEEQRKLLGVAREAARTVGQLYAAVVTKRDLTWLTKSDAAAYWQPEMLYDATAECDRLLTVTEALGLPAPDVSWMTVPFKKDRGDYLVWLQPPASEASEASSAVARVDVLPSEVEDGPEALGEILNDRVVLDLADPIARFAARNYALLIRNTQEALAKELLARIKRFES